MTFSKSKIMKEDNYHILDSIDENTMILDDILLSIPYYLDNAYTKTKSIYARHQKY